MTTHPSNKAGRDWQADLNIELLNDIFEPLPFEDRLRLLYRYVDQQDVMVTSSFGTKSVFLLHLLHRIRPSQRIHFIDTTYHFPETLAYKEQLTETYGLRVEDLRPAHEENALTRDEKWWLRHPRMCCSINKIAPLEPVKAGHKVWISGLMAYQTDYRARLKIFERQGDIIKFHPIIDIDEGEFLYYLSYHKLPRHPLEAMGYGSIGCTHCTFRGQGREGRWQGSNQTECGLHPGYFLNKVKEKEAG